LKFKKMSYILKRKTEICKNCTQGNTALQYVLKLSGPQRSYYEFFITFTEVQLIRMMEKSPDLQKVLFESIRSSLPSHLSLVDEIAELLNLSSDSAYRRIRGDKTLTLDEAETLAAHFNISLDNLMGIRPDSVTFRLMYLDEEKYGFTSYLRTVLGLMENLMQQAPVELIFQLNELNLFHAVQFPDILAFKIFFWSKSNLDFPSYRNRKFSLSAVDEENYELSSLIASHFMKFNTTELLTQEFLLSFLKQLEYYWISGFFEKRDDVITLCNSALDLIEHLRNQAEAGCKYLRGSEPSGIEDNLKFYSNNLTLTDNVILVCSGGQGTTYLTNGAINLLFTNNQDFFRQNLIMVRNIIKKSTLISGNAERERNWFFNNIHESVIRARERVSR